MEPLELFARRQVLSVSQLVGQIKDLAEGHFDFVWVEGEITGLRRPGSGHLYFALKDDQAMLRAVLFRHQAALIRFQLEDGQRVLCQGRVSVYTARGEMQLIVDVVEPRGAGALALAFEQLKRRLEAEGLFDPERKRPLPDLPQKIALVTSPSGAAIRDFLHVLHRRFDRVAVAVYPVPVQGEDAAPAMVQALADLAAWGWPEVIVLTRGGGSPEDLWAFNDEQLARAIAACPIPVVSAVGHEIDVTISDLVADLRAPTPSAAAELLVRNRAELTARLRNLELRLARLGGLLVARRRERLAVYERVLRDPRRRLADLRLRLDDLLGQGQAALETALHRRARGLGGLRERLLARRPDQRLVRLQARRQALAYRLNTLLIQILRADRAALDQAQARLRSLSPLAVLGRGYALARDEQGRVLRRADQAQPGQALRVLLAQGALKVRVEEVEP